MRLKIIFCSEQNRFKETISLLNIGEKYYERYGDYLIQYEFISKISSLNGVFLKKEVILLVVDYLSIKEKALLEKLQTYNNVFLIQPSEAYQFKEAISLPQLWEKEWQFEVFHKLLKTLLNIKSHSVLPFFKKLQGHHLIIGEEEVLGSLMINLLQSFHHMQHYKDLDLEIYSAKSLGIEEMSEVEELVGEYTQATCYFEESQNIGKRIAYTLIGK